MSTTLATQILANLGYFSQVVPIRKFRYATPERYMRKGEDGLRRAGRYSKGLTKWRTGKLSKGRV